MYIYSLIKKQQNFQHQILPSFVLLRVNFMAAKMDIGL